MTVYMIPPRSLPLETAIDRVRSEVLGELAAEGRLPRDVTLSITGAGDYDLSLFTDIKDKDIRKKVSDYFVKESYCC